RTENSFLPSQKEKRAICSCARSGGTNYGALRMTWRLLEPSDISCPRISGSSSGAGQCNQCCPTYLRSPSLWDTFQCLTRTRSSQVHQVIKAASDRRYYLRRHLNLIPSGACRPVRHSVLLPFSISQVY